MSRSLGVSRVAELILRITDRYQLKIVQVYAPTTSHSDSGAGTIFQQGGQAWYVTQPFPAGVWWAL